MSEAKYPSLYLSASAASKAAQQRLLALTRLHLVLLAVIAILTGIAGIAITWQRWVAVGTLVLLLAALTVSWATRMRRFDDQWFAARALAENVKSAMWHYIALPSQSKPEDDQRFRQALKEIRQRLPESRTCLGAHLVSSPEITPWMETSRSAPLPARVAQFRTERLRDQREWYSSKAQANATTEATFWTAILVIEVVGVLGAVLQVWMLGGFNPVGGVATVSAGLLAWSQTKRYSELANTYTVAAEDLADLDAQFEPALTPADFDRLVRDVETAISREHSLWVSRRMT